MLPLRYRLKNKKAFNAVFRRGKTVAESFLVMKYAFDEVDTTQIGFSAGMKYSKKASERNKAKRWMREAARSMLRNIKPGYQIIFIMGSAKDTDYDTDYQEIKKIMENMLRKAKIL